MNKVTNITIYTDGSCMLNGNNPCYGGVGVHFDHPGIKDLSYPYKGTEVTNQRMELLACIKGIDKVVKYMYKHNPNNSPWHINLYTDSMYSINCATIWSQKWILYNWKRPIGKQLKSICNVDLIKKLYRLSRMYPVSFHHVKAHCKEPPKTNNSWNLWNGNYIADKLAGAAMSKARQSPG